MGKKVKIAGIDDAIECPAALAYLWRYFAELTLGLASNGFGPAMVTWESLKAWADFTAIVLEPWEAMALVTLGHRRAVIDGEERAKRGKT